jgi:hypothetical protein
LAKVGVTAGPFVLLSAATQPKRHAAPAVEAAFLSLGLESMNSMARHRQPSMRTPIAHDMISDT